MNKKSLKAKAKARQKKHGGSYQAAWHHVSQQSHTGPVHEEPRPGDRAQRYVLAYRRLMRAVPFVSRHRQHCTLHLDPYRAGGPGKRGGPPNLLSPFRRMEFHNREREKLVSWDDNPDEFIVRLPEGPDRHYSDTWRMDGLLRSGVPEEQAQKDFLEALEKEFLRGSFERMDSLPAASEIAWAIGLGQIRRGTVYDPGDLSPFQTKELRDWLVRLDAEEYFGREVTDAGIGVSNMSTDGRYRSFDTDLQVQYPEIRRRTDEALARGERPRVEYRSTGSSPPRNRLEEYLDLLEAAGISEVGPPVDTRSLLGFLRPKKMAATGWEEAFEKLVLTSLKEYRQIAARSLGKAVQEFPIGKGTPVRFAYDFDPEDIDPMSPQQAPRLDIVLGCFEGDTDDQVARMEPGWKPASWADGLSPLERLVRKDSSDFAYSNLLSLDGGREVPQIQQDGGAPSGFEEAALFRRMLYFWLEHDRRWEGDSLPKYLREIALG